MRIVAECLGAVQKSEKGGSGLKRRGSRIKPSHAKWRDHECQSLEAGFWMFRFLLFWQPQRELFGPQKRQCTRKLNQPRSARRPSRNARKPLKVPPAVATGSPSTTKTIFFVDYPWFPYRAFEEEPTKVFRLELLQRQTANLPKLSSCCLSSTFNYQSHLFVTLSIISIWRCIARTRKMMVLLVRGKCSISLTSIVEVFSKIRDPNTDA